MTSAKRSFQDRLRARLAAAQARLEEAMRRVTEAPSLPEPVRAVLRSTRQSLLNSVKSVRSKDDLKNLRPSMEGLVADAVEAIATGSLAEPGNIHTTADLRHVCSATIKYSAGAVDGVALVAGTFAVSAAVPSGGISFGHFFALCAVTGLLCSLTIGACEVYAVTSLLVHQGSADPVGEALRICAYPRKYRRDRGGVAALEASDVGSEADSGNQAESLTLAKTWVKLSIAGAMPVFNDRHTQDRLDALIATIEARS